MEAPNVTMKPADRGRVEAFLGKWQGSEGNERANYQTFFGDLCRALGVEEPPPKGTIAGDPYCFDKDIKFVSDKSESTRFADFYKQDCFLIEAKQGSDSSGKGHGRRGTKVYRDNLQKAFNQARSYAYNRLLGSMPPFLMVCDIGSHFEVWEGFSGDYGSYGARQEVKLADLLNPEVFDRFVKIFTDPQSLNPERLRARVTREVAAELAKLSRWLEEQGHGADETASFLMRCIFTMFAEDVELLKGEVFTKALCDRWIPHPETFKPQIEQLWQTMNTGGSFGFERVLRFNGSFFEDAVAFELPREQLEVLYGAAVKDWSQVEPAIFGTLLERALEKKERSRLGAHYTPRSYVERLVRPVVMEPLRQEWDEIEIELKRLLEPEPGKEEPTANQRKKAEQEIRTFLMRLRTIRVLDPACGTGNFLYVCLDLLKGLEAEVQTRLVDVGGDVQLGLEQVNPSQFLGIEINPRAAAIAELVIWIGYLQWFFKRFGNTEPPEPVLQAFGNIECRDAVLAYDGREPDVDLKTGRVRTRWGGRMMRHPVTGEEVPDPSDQVVIYRYLNPRPAEWPAADYVVSNPPFLGKLYMLERLGEGYVNTLREAYAGQVPDGVDFVMYWWYKASHLIARQLVQRFGFITTKSIGQTFNRRVVNDALNLKPPLSLVFAVPNHPWVDTENSAAVRIAMTVAALGEHSGKLMQVIHEENVEDGEVRLKFDIQTGIIYEDLRIGADLSSTLNLTANNLLASTGLILGNRGFVLTEIEADSFYKQEFAASSLIFPLRNGRDLTDQPRGFFVIDTDGWSEERLRQEAPMIYQHLYERVYPERQTNPDKRLRENWWLFRRSNERVRTAIKGLSRFIVTPETSKHRFFIFLPEMFKPEHKLVVVGSDDAFIIGVLSSRIHVHWALMSGGRLGVGNDPVYVKTRCFDPFPFPDPTPEQKQKIRELGDRLDSHRKRVQTAHPDITITGMYNLLEKLRAGEPFTDKDREYNDRALVSTLKQIHDDLDRAVLDAYGWPPDITDEQILENLVQLNADRAEEERNGLIRWLRPEYQAPEQAQPVQAAIAGLAPEEIEAIAQPTQPQKWPTQPKEQLAAIHNLLRTQPGTWSIPQIAAQFTGKNTPKKLQTITDNLDRLEFFGLVIPDPDRTHWHTLEPRTIA